MLDVFQVAAQRVDEELETIMFHHKETMSIKTTSRVKPERAREILLSEIPTLPCDVLGDLLDVLAESEASHFASKFDNFIVSEFE